MTSARHELQDPSRYLAFGADPRGVRARFGELRILWFGGRESSDGGLQDRRGGGKSGTPRLPGLTCSAWPLGQRNVRAVAFELMLCLQALRLVEQSRGFSVMDD
jgi:hypothetical protein